MKLKEANITGKKLELDNSEVNLLGPDLILDNCEIVSNCKARALSFNGVKFLNCTFNSKVIIKDFQWCKSYLDGTRLIGHYSGCDFGKWPEFHGEFGGVVNCDFSNAILENCRIMNTDISTIEFPGWPCFVIPEPQKRASEIASYKWPGELIMIMEIFADSPDGTSAVVGYAVELVNQLGGSEDEFKEALIGLGGVYL